ncbi:Helicase conserved C-terminal domain-containing protein [Actinopolyspora alba]|uniref:Helicase conserved C-terminal domain-containing protein n=1 Tax=Actinopolyspora alba TaxID=673379 RepID=A0A1I1Y9X5_9ACTN|nr:helicase-related protein [Actinopolyspora alba]SFE16122.1 Helicase conserved C-terminal domain-containing protein [Actinopolyspora alba]
MNLTESQQLALKHLRDAYVGPEGEEEEITYNPPHRQYAVGMLFPRDNHHSHPPEGRGQSSEDIEADIVDGDVEEDGVNVPLAENWRPSSAAISFVTNSERIKVDFSCATYVRIGDDGPPRWKRIPHSPDDLVLFKEQEPILLKVGEVQVAIGARWRDYNDAQLITVHVRVLTKTTEDERLDIPLMLFQVGLSVAPCDGARILEYDTTRSFDADPEAAELRVRYRNRKVYAVGHGMAADWELVDDGCVRAFLDPVPAFVVPAVETTGLDEGTPEARALELRHLARIDENRTEVLPSLRAFVDAFAEWADEQMARAEDFGRDAEVAIRIAKRSEDAVARMREGVELLDAVDQEQIRIAFALGMEAMRLQMRQADRSKAIPEEQLSEPHWRPFQLGFLLIALASTVNPEHDDRDLVDLIWFPTGGGKTEAYLGLAAVEIFRRRLAHGVSGGGTAVLTRYTLRLLTSQQFQRAAALVCAMELMRADHPRVRGMAPFSIGLWVGNEIAPGTRKEAVAALDRLMKAARPEEANQFQVESCPWCLTPLIPRLKSDRSSDYGLRREGSDVVLHCVDPKCEFRKQLPLAVVDEVLYEEPPTILLATVDKFARLQFKPEAGKLLGLGTSFKQPSMVIQDELHLLSGPLGTTVAVFDAVIQVLLSSSGTTPKIVASTATIRASGEQVQGLYGRQVALYPSSGLDDDRTFFSKPVENGEGRLYIGLMPQSVSQPSAVISATTPMLEIPDSLAMQSKGSPSRDAYWTLVMYHNSLRELGRSSALVVDDVNGRLEPRSERLDIPLRQVDKPLELTSRKGAEELPRDLRALRVNADDSEEAVDVVLSSNMLSVGIDVPRLALMLMVGQPKTTAEYIQATSRVGRGDTRGIVVTLFRSSRARDRSHFETFRGYHEALYRSVEPTSLTPWSLASRDRSLAGALVALLRQSLPPLADNDTAVKFDLDDPRARNAVEGLVEKFLFHISRSEPFELQETEDAIWSLLRDWDRRASQAREDRTELHYERRSKSEAGALLKRFGEPGEGWLVGDSMRSVEPNVAVEVQEPQ